MWEKVAADFRTLGGRIEMGARASRIRHDGERVTAIEIAGPGGAGQELSADAYIVSMPLQETVLAFDPPLPADVRAAAAALGYRDFLTVALIIEGPNPFPDNWIYIHEPDVRLGRIQNFRNWSEAMIGQPGTTCLGLEYFCFAGDGLWTMTDQALIELGKEELGRLGLIGSSRVIDGSVVRIEKAYPVYDSGYQRNVDLVRAALAPFANLQVVGRNGMHKYNNQDHSMMTAMLAVRNLDRGGFNLWNVNTDAEYHEEGGKAGETTGRGVPQRVK
jgi:protoporphyrinogen oxidase